MDIGINRQFWEDIAAPVALWNLLSLVQAECYSLWSQLIDRLAYVGLLPAMKVLTQFTGFHRFEVSNSFRQD